MVLSLSGTSETVTLSVPAPSCRVSFQAYCAERIDHNLLLHQSLEPSDRNGNRVLPWEAMATLHRRLRPMTAGLSSFRWPHSS